jgi:hypothetical protein
LSTDLLPPRLHSLHLLMEAFLVFYSQCACSPEMLMSNPRISVSTAIQMLVSHFLRFLQTGYGFHFVYAVSSCSSTDSGPSCGILDLADAANVLVERTDSIPRSVARATSFPLIVRALGDACFRSIFLVPRFPHLGM